MINDDSKECFPYLCLMQIPDARKTLIPIILTLFKIYIYISPNTWWMSQLHTSDAIINTLNSTYEIRCETNSEHTHTTQ